MSKFPPIIDLPADAATNGSYPVFEALTEGALVILRGVEQIIQGRRALIETAATAVPAGNVADELLAFYDDAVAPSMNTVHALSQAVKIFREKREWSRRLHGLFAQIDLPAPILYDGGIPRLLLGSEFVEAAKQSGLFEPGDFMRTSPTGKTEIFSRVTPDATPIHRDYNRDHYLFQMNLWFCLHSTEVDEVIRVFPEHYHHPVFTMECTPEALAQVGDPLEFELDFGDAVLFHGEHLHASPVGKPGRRRQSLDFRAAVACHDDNRHYHEGFINAANFGRAADDPAAIDMLVELEDAAPTAERLTAILDAFEDLPFAEDRYLLLADKAAGIDNAVADWAIKTVISRSDLYYWVLAAGR
ncbi:MAG: hypothetical protein O3B08_14245 [Proteobacteria bacterium]|nr:hypothetical protein [Pseudomonadota bacterium]